MHIVRLSMRALNHPHLTRQLMSAFPHLIHRLQHMTCSEHLPTAFPKRPFSDVDHQALIFSSLPQKIANLLRKRVPFLDEESIFEHTGAESWSGGHHRIPQKPLVSAEF